MDILNSFGVCYFRKSIRNQNSDVFSLDIINLPKPHKHTGSALYLYRCVKCEVSVVHYYVELQEVWAADRKIISYYNVNLHKMPSLPGLSVIWICGVTQDIMATNEVLVTPVSVTCDVHDTGHDMTTAWPGDWILHKTHITSECQTLPTPGRWWQWPDWTSGLISLFDKNILKWFYIQLFVAKSFKRIIINWSYIQK